MKVTTSSASYNKLPRLFDLLRGGLRCGDNPCDGGLLLLLDD